MRNLPLFTILCKLRCRCWSFQPIQASRSCIFQAAARPSSFAPFAPRANRARAAAVRSDGAAVEAAVGAAPSVPRFLDNSSSTRTAWIQAFTPSSMGEVGATAQSALNWKQD
jgi:hypothetical protein